MALPGRTVKLCYTTFVLKYLFHTRMFQGSFLF